MKGDTMGQTDKYTDDAAVQAGERAEAEPVETQQPDTPGNDENGDGVTGGQATADTTGDVLGI